MPDFKVTFRGDLGNLSAFDAAIKNSAISSERALTRANQNIASQIGKIDGLLKSSSGAGVFIKKTQGIADAVNNTFQQSGETVRRFVRTYESDLNKVGRFEAKPVFGEAYHSSFKEARGNLRAYEKALQDILPHEKELLRVRRNLANTQSKIGNERIDTKAARDAVQKRLDKPDSYSALGRLRSEEVAAQRQLQQARDALKQSGLQPGQRGIGTFNRTIQQQEANLRAIRSNISKEEAALKTEIAKYNATLNSLGQAEATALRNAGRLERNIGNRRAFKDLDLAANATPPIQADLNRVLKDSPQLQQRLLRGGLGMGAQYGTGDFQRALAQQEAQVSSYTRNLRTNVRTVQGEFKDASGLMNKFTVDLDEQGKVVGRWGGQLGGAGSILRQTVRDFQKVIEWTVATTVVFGSLAAVVGQLQNINELNTLLARFAITAQTSAEQTGDMFDRLTQVSIATATPLKEIVTVADDIALATKSANQSMEEWEADIVSLTSAVGIFTNLTGKETVAAADQLSSTFKQLGIAPQEVITVLNKVTAVAGGQANAIADIVQSISGLAEAARAAGFSVDEQIAAVQVLGQVTNKTSAEIATSFKNLFGSVSSVGSEKILATFGIAVRDAEGGVRDFLDIYRDVARALDQGIIPQNRLPDVLRGISGGPRRAPDAAALLSNIGRIDEVIERSAGATNEALVANAKILDTNQAKLIQFQNSVDATIFKQFGEAVRDLTSALVDIGNVFTGLIGGLPSEIVTAVLKLGLLTAGLLTFVKLMRLLSSAVGIPAFVKNLRSMGTQFQSTAAQMTLDAEFARRFPDQAGMLGVVGNRTPRTPATGFGAGVRNRLPPIGGRGALLGAGAIAAGSAAAGFAGGGALNSIGTGLAIGGAVATLIPGLQAVGIAATIAGLAIQTFGGNTEEAKQKVADHSAEIYDMTLRLKSVQDEANNYARTQKVSLGVIEQLQQKTALTADEQGKLATATQDYVTSTLALANANKTVAASFQEIIDKLDLGSKYNGFLKDLQAGGKKGGPTGTAIKDLQQKLAADILRGTGQAIFSGSPVGLATGAVRRPGTGGGTSVTGIGGRTTRGGQNIEGNVVNLSDLIDDPSLITKFVDVNLGELVPGSRIPQNEESLRLLQGAVSALTAQFVAGEGTLTQQQLNNLVEVISTMAAASSTFTQNAIALGQQAANIQAKVLTGQFTAEQGQRATSANTLAQRLGTAAAGVRPQYGREGAEVVNPNVTRALEVQRQLAQLAEEGLKPSNALLQEAVELTFKLTGQYETLGKAGEQALRVAVLEILKEIGVEEETLAALTAGWGLEVQKVADQAALLSANLDVAKKNARETFAQRALDLEVAENSGEYEKNSQGLAILKQQNQEAYNSTIALIDAIGTLSTGSLVELNNSLSNVIGLQGLFISNTELQRIEGLEAEEQAEEWAAKIDDLSSSLIENAVKAGVNAEGIRKIRDQVALLIATLAAVPNYKRVIVEVQTIMRTSSATQLGGGDFGKNLQTQLNQAKKEEAKAKKAGTDPSSVINKIIDSINKTIRSGSGSQIGQLPKTEAAKKAKKAKAVSPPDVSLLDIPEEILESPNAKSLIAKAISNAKGLQSLVPGANKANKTDIVELLNGTKRIMETRGVGEEYLRRAMDELRDEIKRQNDLLSKADTIRRIRVGGGDFSAIANVPINSISGVSVGGPQGPISVALDVNGTVFSPAQLQTFADMVAASLKRQLAS